MPIRAVVRIQRMLFGLIAGFTVSCGYAAESGHQTVTSLATLGRLAVGLIFVLIVFWVFARIMRQLQGRHYGIHQDFKIVAALAVGQRERLLVVQAGTQQVLVGVTSTQINALHVLDTPLKPRNDNTIDPDGFSSKMAAALKRQGVQR